MLTYPKGDIDIMQQYHFLLPFSETCVFFNGKSQLQHHFPILDLSFVSAQHKVEWCFKTGP